MKSMTYIKHFLILFLVCMTTSVLYAQDPPPPPPPPDPLGGGGWVPIDGGIAALLVAGLGYGAKKAYEYRSKRQTNSSNKMD